MRKYSSRTIPNTIILFSCVLLLFFASTQTPRLTINAAPINTGDSAIWDYLPGTYVAPLRTDAIRITIFSQDNDTINFEIAIWTTSQSWARYNDSTPLNQTTSLWYTNTPQVADPINDIIYKSSLLVTNIQNITDPTTGQDALLVSAGTDRSLYRITYDLSSQFALHIEAKFTICCGQIDSFYSLYNSTIDLGIPSAPPMPITPPLNPFLITSLLLVILIPTIITLLFLVHNYNKTNN